MQKLSQTFFHHVNSVIKSDPIVFGIDPGSHSIGIIIGGYDFEKKATTIYTCHNVVTSNERMNEHTRLMKLYERVEDIIVKVYHSNLIFPFPSFKLAIERPPTIQKRANANQLVIGSYYIICKAFRKTFGNEIEIIDVQNLRWKKHFTGAGDATKELIVKAGKYRPLYAKIYKEMNEVQDIMDALGVFDYYVYNELGTRKVV